MNSEKIAELRKERGRGLISAVGEYTPDELWQALDCIEALRAERDALRDRIEEAFRAGFCAPETYNDTVMNSADEAWAKEKDDLLRPPARAALKGE